MALASSFLPEEVSVNAAPQVCSLRKANSSTVCPTCSSDCYFYIVPRLFACLLCSCSTVLSGLYPSQVWRPLQLQALNPVAARTHGIQPLLMSKTLALRKHSPCEFLCSSPSLLTNHVSFPCTAAMICFFPKPHFHTSYHL